MSLTKLVSSAVVFVVLASVTVDPRQHANAQVYLRYHRGPFGGERLVVHPPILQPGTPFLNQLVTTAGPIVTQFGTILLGQPTTTTTTTNSPADPVAKGGEPVKKEVGAETPDWKARFDSLDQKLDAIAKKIGPSQEVAQPDLVTLLRELNTKLDGFNQKFDGLKGGLDDLTRRVDKLETLQQGAARNPTINVVPLPPATVVPLPPAPAPVPAPAAPAKNAN